MSQPLFSDLVAFVINNKGNTFKEYKDEMHIAFALKRALDKNLLYYSIDERGDISGMIMAEIHDNNVLFIVENLSMNLKNLKEFARMAKDNFKGYKIEWLKRGIHKQHNTEKIWKKFI